MEGAEWPAWCGHQSVCFAEGIEGIGKPGEPLTCNSSKEFTNKISSFSIPKALYLKLSSLTTQIYNYLGTWFFPLEKSISGMFVCVCVCVQHIEAFVTFLSYCWQGQKVCTNSMWTSKNIKNVHIDKDFYMYLITTLHGFSHMYFIHLKSSMK